VQTVNEGSDYIGVTGFFAGFPWQPKVQFRLRHFSLTSSLPLIYTPVLRSNEREPLKYGPGYRQIGTSLAHNDDSPKVSDSEPDPVTTRRLEEVMDDTLGREPSSQRLRHVPRHEQVSTQRGNADLRCPTEACWPFEYGLYFLNIARPCVVGRAVSACVVALCRCAELRRFSPNNSGDDEGVAAVPIAVVGNREYEFLGAISLCVAIVTLRGRLIALRSRKEAAVTVTRVAVADEN
jgi:hypothetical protein